MRREAWEVEVRGKVIRTDFAGGREENWLFSDDDEEEEVSEESGLKVHFRVEW